MSSIKPVIKKSGYTANLSLLEQTRSKNKSYRT